MSKQGLAMDYTTVNKICTLLASTDMPMPDIARRVGVARSSVIATNDRFGIRDYNGKKSEWVTTDGKKHGWYNNHP